MTEFGELIQTEDGSWTIRHKEHGQDFHSTEGARFEAYQLYVVASGFLEELEHLKHINVLDVGMGLGYNACASIAAWLNSSGQSSLDLFSLEHDPRLIAAIASGCAPWFEGWSEDWLLAPKCLKAASNGDFMATIRHPKTGQNLNWKIFSGDGSATLSKIGNSLIHFVWQDPFTPELNPRMWSKEWFQAVKQHSAEGAILMTYSVARIVREALMDAGWQVERIATPGRKRNWLKAKI